MMTTKLKMLPVRVSPAVRALIDQAGPVNAATRALIILGAEAAGLDLTGLELEIAGLLPENLTQRVGEELRRLLLRGQALKVSEREDGALHDDRREDISRNQERSAAITNDPFNDIGVEV